MNPRCPTRSGVLLAEQGVRQAWFELRVTGELYTASAPVTVAYAW
ncbi:hypothetical protein [Streptomyces sp. N50]|nr:hypothetical protein [Streptomyces sp. N50]WOX14373.1 hypothetical protein R2B38_38495 [Streptomyces sp. N50]